MLKKCLLPNTTFLIGRKGTGKSTIFLRLEKELDKREDAISCYLDVYTIYTESQRTLSELNHLEEKIPLEILRKYLLERNFIQNILIALIKQFSNNTNNILEKIKSSLGINKKEAIKELLEELLQNIEDNETLKKIEIPLVEEVLCKSKLISSNKQDKGISSELGTDLNITKPNITAKIEGKSDFSNISEKELAEEFSKVFVKVFQINDLIQKTKSILQTIKVKHLYILLDDFSEIDNFAISNFVNIK